MSSEYTMKNSRGEEVSLPEEQRQQVISYLKYQGGKPAGDLVTLIRRGAKLLDEALAGVTEAQAALRPAEGEWSIREVLRHVEASCQGCARVIAALARGESDVRALEQPPLSDDDDSLAGLRHRVVAAYEALERTVGALEGADTAATAPHPFFGQLNCKEWAAFVYVHSRDHVNQIEQVKTGIQPTR